MSKQEMHPHELALELLSYKLAQLDAALMFDIDTMPQPTKDECLRVVRKDVEQMFDITQKALRSKKPAPPNAAEDDAGTKKEVEEG